MHRGFRQKRPEQNGVSAEHNRKARFRINGFRAVSLVLFVLMLTAVIPVFRAGETAAAANVNYTTREVYRWHRVRKQSCDEDNSLCFRKNGTTWSIGTRDDKSSDYGEEVDAGHVSIYNNRTGCDRYLDSSGDRMSISETGAFDYKTCSMLLYVLERIPYSAIGDTTVASGESLQLKNNTILNDGKTLIVEPGATLTIDGDFYNNGTVLNYGTVIIEENACMCPLDPATLSGGSISCFGSAVRYRNMTAEGNLIVLQNGILAQVSPESTFLLDGGASFFHYGIAVIPGAMHINNARVFCGPDAGIVSHFRPGISDGFRNSGQRIF